MKNKTNVYLTDLDKDSLSQTDKENEKNDTIPGGAETKTTFKSKAISQAQYLKDHATEFEKTKLDFLGYIINDQTKFADFGKISDFYQNSLVENVSITNKNLDELELKKEKLKKLERVITETVVNTVRLDDKDIIANYEKILKDTSLEIDKQNLLLEGYTVYRDNLHFENFKIKSKLMKLLRSAETQGKQYDNYMLIHDKANSTLRKQYSMFDKLADYNCLTKQKNIKTIENKKKIFQDLEVQIINVKQNSADNQARLIELEQLNKDTKEAVYEQQRRNFNMNNSNYMQHKEYVRAKLNIFKLKTKLKLESIIDVVKIYKDERMKYDGLFLLYTYLNKQISDLNMLYTDYEKEKLEIERRIVLKETKSITLKENPLEFDTMLSQTVESQLINVKEENFILRDLINHSVDRIRTAFDLLKKYYKPLEFLRALASSLRTDGISKKKKEMSNFSGNVEYTDYIELTQIEDWQEKDVRKAINFIMDFQRNFYIVYMNMYCRLILQSAKILKSFESESDLLTVIKIGGKDGIRVDEAIKGLSHPIESPTKQHSKRVIREEETINGEGKTNGSTPDKKKKKKDEHFMRTTLNSLHNAYLKHNVQQNNEENLQVLTFSKRKIMTKVLDFTNNLVDDDLIKLPKNLKRTVVKPIHGNSKKLKLNKSDGKGLVGGQQNLVDEESEEEEQNNSYLSINDDPHLEIINTHHKKKRNLALSNTDSSENVQVFKRMSDILTLNLKYFNNKPQPGEVKSDYANELHKKNKQEELYNSEKFKNKSTRLSSFNIQHAKSKFVAIPSLTGTDFNNMNKTGTKFNPSNSLKFNKSGSGFFSPREVELATRRDSANAYESDVFNSAAGLRRSDSCSKISSTTKNPLYLRSFSNWRNNELKDKLPQLLTQIRQNSQKQV